MPPLTANPWRFCVAPMMDWTDRHCRFFLRQLSALARLYTEMVNTGAVLHGDARRHLRFDAAEHPVALQLGGSEPEALARAAEAGAAFGYDEINLNCGCPSDRVQEGRFGACLMAEPKRVAAAVAAMRRASGLPVTVKCRIGIDDSEEYAFLRDFVAAAGGGRLRYIRRARAQSLAFRPLAQGEPRDSATALRSGLPPQAGAAAAHGGDQRRHPQLRRL